MSTRRRFLAPEVVQTSSMDCGPAALTCLLEGFGVRASYGRLREACQTDVDGTSIDTIEEIATRLGLDAEQVMLPADHLLDPTAGMCPALVIMRLPGGGTHFIVSWRRHGGAIQIMDPSIGRRWVSEQRFLESVYMHTAKVPASTWRAWAASEPVLALTRARLARMGIDAEPFTRTALHDAGWQSLAALDAGRRTVVALLCARGCKRGREATHVLRRLTSEVGLIQPQYWSVESAGHDDLAMRGAVLLHIRGVRRVADNRSLPSELAAALAEHPSRPGRELCRLMREDGILAPSVVAAALVLAGAGVVLEAVLLRGFLEIGRELPFLGERIAATVAMGSWLLILLLLDAWLAALVTRLGRHLEIRLRLRFLRKVPRLGDRYFQSRLKSDMAERSHVLHRIRGVPDLGARVIRSTFELLFTTGAIIWIDPATAPIAVCGAFCAASVPLLAQPAIAERDLRVRTHTGALGRFYLDALLALVPIRTHGGERALRREHGRLLGEWARAGLDLQRTAVRVEGLQLLAAFGCAVWAVLGNADRLADAGSVLLLVYWLLNLPAIGEDIALAAWQYPCYRNTALRALEPLSAPETLECVSPSTLPRGTGGTGVTVTFAHLSVRASGHTILQDIDLEIPAGSHVAIVGASGAGKSSLVGVLLGWHRAADGMVLVDGRPLDTCLHALRRESAWVDPAVQLWNRSVTENLRYGCSVDEPFPATRVIDAAALWAVIQKLPSGLETRLGEGGGLLSGGEGQRVRLARALLRPEARLVILDEPFRGLDGADRRELLARARVMWRHATLLCITHDIAQTTDFTRVLVLESGRVVEDGQPECLAASSTSRYRAMLDREISVRQALWRNGRWQRAQLKNGDFHLAAS